MNAYSYQVENNAGALAFIAEGPYKAARFATVEAAREDLAAFVSWSTGGGMSGTRAGKTRIVKVTSHGPLAVA